MKKYLLVFLLYSGWGLACGAQDPGRGITEGQGFRQESFHWSIAGNSAGRNPNVLSELRWRRLQGMALDLTGRWPVWKWLSAEVKGGYASLVSTRVSDTDYGADNRQDPVYEGQFVSNNGSVADWALGLGAALIRRTDCWLRGSLGYGVSYQRLGINGKGGSYAGLDSRYDTHWNGPYVAADLVKRIGGDWELYGLVDYRQLVYRATANWNLVSSFMHPVSFRHRADGYGIGGTVGAGYRLSASYRLRLDVRWEHWATGAGTDELYLVSGAVAGTRMNGAFRDVWQVGLGFGWNLK